MPPNQRPVFLLIRQPIRYAACALALGLLAPAWAINKCTDAQGKVSFQDAPCAGQPELT